MPAQLPYTKDKSIFTDLLKLAQHRILRSSCCDSFLDRNSLVERTNVIKTYASLSSETKTLIRYQVWKNHHSPLDRGNDFGGDFLIHNPLDETVLSAFRTVTADLKEDVRDFVSPSKFAIINAGLWIMDKLAVLKEKLNRI